MAQIYVARGRQQLGQFSAQQVAEGLKSGRFLPTDLAWREGMPEWRPLSEFADLQRMAETEGANELAKASELESEVWEKSETTGPMPAWENRASLGLVTAAIETIKQVLTAPSVTFASMPRAGGYRGPLIFFVILGWVGMVVSAMYNLVSFLINPEAMRASLGEVTENEFFLGVGFIILLAPAFLVIYAYLNAIILHFFLWIVGGARHSLETTFRVQTYTLGALFVFQLIPICGPFLYSVWYFYPAIVGLAKAHETETWRAAIAVLLPFILFCGLVIALISVAVGVAAASAAGAATP